MDLRHRHADVCVDNFNKKIMKCLILHINYTNNIFSYKFSLLLVVLTTANCFFKCVTHLAFFSLILPK